MLRKPVMVFMVFLVLMLGNVGVEASGRQFVATTEEPVSFRIYKPATVTLELNYTRQGYFYSAYDVYQNGNLIYTTKQGDDFFPPRVNSADIEPGFYDFQVSTLNSSRDEDGVPLVRNRSNSELLIAVTCESGDCFTDPMLQEMQRMQRWQREEQQRQTQQRNMQFNNTGTDNIFNHNDSFHNNSFMGF